MTKPFSARTTLESAMATAALAERIAPLLIPGDTILLRGEIGAGKSHFARSLIQARLRAVGPVEDVPSPTYTIVQTYNDDICDIWHADLYRLTDIGEVYELGLVDAFEDSICIVEWPEILGATQPANALTLQLAEGSDDDHRQATLSFSDPRWSKIQPLIKDWDSN